MVETFAKQPCRRVQSPTVARYGCRRPLLHPNGDDIHLVGIEPNITVKRLRSLWKTKQGANPVNCGSRYENDAQLFAALEASLDAGVGVAIEI